MKRWLRSWSGALAALVIACSGAPNAGEAAAGPEDEESTKDSNEPAAPAPGDPGADAAADADAAPAVPDGGDAGAAGKLTLFEPVSGARAVAGKAVRFRGRAACKGSTIELVADGAYVFATATASPDFDVVRALASPGVARPIEVREKPASGAGAHCAGTASIALTVQRPLAHAVDARVDVNGCTYELRTITVPTADPDVALVTLGGAQARTVKTFGQANAGGGVAGTINAGYFAFGSGPVSYAKGHLGYESASGNVKGPRACLAYDAVKRKARIVVSHGRAPAAGGWGASLFPNDADVACAGPQLVEAGKNVALAHVASEDFAASGINQSAPYPRTAACVLDDGGVLLVVAQSSAQKACGLSLPSLADVLIARGCTSALNLDGGGSSAIWWKGPPAAYHEGTEDRPVYQALGVTAK